MCTSWPCDLHSQWVTCDIGQVMGLNVSVTCSMWVTWEDCGSNRQTCTQNIFSSLLYNIIKAGQNYKKRKKVTVTTYYQWLKSNIKNRIQQYKNINIYVQILANCQLTFSSIEKPASAAAEDGKDTDAMSMIGSATGGFTSSRKCSFWAFSFFAHFSMSWKQYVLIRWTIATHSRAALTTYPFQTENQSI